MKNYVKGSFIAAAALMCVVGMSTKADAALMAYICDDALCTGGGDTIITDQGVGDNFPGSTAVGQINSGAVNVAGFSIVSNISQSKPQLGSASAPQMDLTFQATTTDAAAHTVWLYASDTGFTAGGGYLFTLGGTQPPVGAGNTISAAAYGGNSNTNLNLANMFSVLGPSTATPFALSSAGTLNPAVNPYGLTIGVVITRTGAGTTTGDLNLQVPEPASMALFGLGLMGFAAVSRRRKANAAK